MDNAWGMLLLDVDGTIVDHSGGLVDGCELVIDWCVKNSVEVGLCSARPATSLRSLAESLTGIKYIAALQGSVLLQNDSPPGAGAKWTVLSEQAIPQATVLELTERLAAYPVWWYTRDCWLIDSVTRVAESEAAVVGSPWDGLIGSRHYEPVMKLLVLDDHAPSDLPAQINSWNLPVGCTESNPGYVEVISSGVETDKGFRVLRESAERSVGSTGLRVAAVGDGRNDLGMLEAASIGLTFADAPDDLIRVAGRVLDAHRPTAMRELRSFLGERSGEGGFEAARVSRRLRASDGSAG